MFDVERLQYSDHEATVCNSLLPRKTLLSALLTSFRHTWCKQSVPCQLPSRLLLILKDGRKNHPQLLVDKWWYTVSKWANLCTESRNTYCSSSDTSGTHIWRSSESLSLIAIAEKLRWILNIHLDSRPIGLSPVERNIVHVIWRLLVLLLGE